MQAKTKKKQIVAILFCLTNLVGISQTMKLNFNCLSCEYSPDSAYAEMQFLFLGKTMTYRQITKNKYQAQVLVNFDFQSLTDSTIHFYNARHFATEIYADSLKDNKNNTYHLWRELLPKDKYKLQMTIQDENNSSEPIRHVQEVDLTFPTNQIFISSIQLLSEFEPATTASYYSKYGWEYFPYFSNFYPEYVNSLSFWAEIYHTEKVLGKEQNFVAEVSISPLGSSEKLEKYKSKKTMKSANNVLLMNTFDISELPSGNYCLQIDIRDEKDTIYAYSTLFFQRSNPSVFATEQISLDNISFDTLKLYFDYMYVVANDRERNFIKHFTQDRYDEGVSFFYKFWQDRNPKNPQEAWYEYYNRVMRVNYNYSTLRFKGYKTDRGICYLKYGPPAEIEPYNFEGTKYPYEIWRYYEVPNGQVNVYFVFYNPDKTTKNYRLLHSTVKGEPQFPNWEEEVKSGHASIKLESESDIF